jgi:hypothetical protein
MTKITASTTKLGNNLGSTLAKTLRLMAPTTSQAMIRSQDGDGPCMVTPFFRSIRPRLAACSQA